MKWGLVKITHVWTIEVDGVARKWKRLEYLMSMNPDPTDFVATVEFAGDIDYFQYVELKNNGTVEFAGYIEDLNPSWDKSGRILEIGGRHISVILWKKFTERFSDTRTEGFFGACDPAKLISFILRCPISDLPSTSSFHKIGWGLDISDWVVSAIRTGAGREEDWVKLREIGLAWQLGPIYDNDCFNVDGFTGAENDWVGAGASPWLGDDDFQATYIDLMSGGGTQNSVLTVNANAGQPNATVADASIFTSEVIRISEGLGGASELMTIQSKFGNVLTFTANLVNNYTVGGGGGVWKTINIVADGFTFENLSHTNGIITSSYIDLFGRWYQNSWAGAVEATVEVYVDIGAGYVYAGDATWAVNEFPVGLGYAIIKKSVDISAIVNTFTKANACKVKLIFAGVDGTRSGARISEMRLRVTGASYQTNGDWFEVNLGADKNRVSGIIVESRMSANKYAKNYVIETSPSVTSWTTQATQNSNLARDIIESFDPVDSVRKIRIRITSDANYEWEISQIYVYCADDRKYCVWNDGSGSTLGPYLSGDLNIDDYIGTYGVVSPLNIPFSRMHDALNSITQKCHDANYDVWDLWVSLDADVNFKARRGSDKSASISFIKGTNLKGAKKEGTTKGVISRARLVGASESKKQDEVSSEWQVNTTAESSLNTFFEEVESSKRVSDKDTADVVAKVKVRTEGNPEEVFTVNVSNDPYDPLAYEVGDDVTVTDSLTGMSGSYRIVAIGKIITKKGEAITIYCGSKWQDISDEWASIRRQLREVGLGNTIIEDWLAGGANQEKMDAEKITGEWEKSAKNDEQKPPADEADDAWEIDDGTGGGGPWSQDIETSDSWFRLKGSKDNSDTPRNIEAYVKSFDEVTPIIRFDKNPKFVCDFKIPVTYEDPDLVLNPVEPTSWRDGDYVYIRMFNASNRGFGFKIIKQDGLYNLYFGLNDASGGYWYRATKTVDGTSINPLINTKYRLEAVVDWDARQVKFFFNNEMIGILMFGGAEDGSSTMYPIYTWFTTSNPAAGVIYWSQIYIYKFSSEWEWVA